MAFVLRLSSSQKGKFLSITELGTSRWLVPSSLQGNLSAFTILVETIAKVTFAQIVI